MKCASHINQNETASSDSLFFQKLYPADSNTPDLGTGVTAVASAGNRLSSLGRQLQDKQSHLVKSKGPPPRGFCEDLDRMLSRSTLVADVGMSAMDLDANIDIPSTKSKVSFDDPDARHTFAATNGASFESGRSFSSRESALFRLKSLQESYSSFRSFNKQFPIVVKRAAAAMGRGADSGSSFEGSLGDSNPRMATSAMEYLGMFNKNVTMSNMPLDSFETGTYFEGDQIGDWVLTKEIGQGSFSRVFEAVSTPEPAAAPPSPPPAAPQHVAIKIVRKQQALNQDYQPFQSHPPAQFAVDRHHHRSQHTLEFLLQEHEKTAIWASLRHEDILELMDVMETPDALFMVTELALGGTLLDFVSSRISRVPRRSVFLRETVVQKIVAQIAGAVRYLHDVAGVIHGDIKSDNLLVMDVDTGDKDWCPVVKLADFGLSERIGAGMMDSTTSSLGPSVGSSSLGQPAFCKGSVHYCAPEEFAPGSESVKTTGSDMWAVGCVVYTMLAGALPFNDDFMPRLILSIRSGDYDASKMDGYGVSGEGKEVVKALLCVGPDVRLTAEELCRQKWLSLS
ncbi:hypothetical protein HDU98_011968 [Podochytrium sp. JEL0797]|nr:hypothetical protein HDU98_011968 [Podochytrium sp. JEL0797]